MRVVLDISQAAYANTGVGVYTIELARALKELRPNAIAFFFGSLRQSPPDGLTPINRFPLPPAALDFLWNRFHVLGPDYLLDHFDLWHASDWTQPPTAKKIVTTVHDLAPFLFPAEHHPTIRAVHGRKMKWVVKEADNIICVSNSTKQDLMRLFNVEEHRIVVIPEAARGIFGPQTDEAVKSVKEKYHLPQQYLLAVGTVQPRKNYERLFKAFSLMRKPPHLVIVGGIGWGEPPAFPERTIHLPSVELADLPALYAGAIALVYPSLYEGFGLPLLEAMSVGTPVVASDTSSMPEVGGSAALYVNPEDVEDMRKTLEIVCDLKAAERNDRIRRGRIHAKKFSWKKTAEQTLAVYQAILPSFLPKRR
ncbi:MAG: glycosyltransferase family 1 protein [bacterium]|nr:glycosyltransferase family 1 protein [bacterium]